MSESQTINFICMCFLHLWDWYRMVSVKDSLFQLRILIKVIPVIGLCITGMTNVSKWIGQTQYDWIDSLCSVSVKNIVRRVTCYYDHYTMLHMQYGMQIMNSIDQNLYSTSKKIAFTILLFERGELEKWKSQNWIIKIYLYHDSFIELASKL